MGLSLEEGQCRGASSWQQGRLQTCIRQPCWLQLLDCLLLLLMKLSNVLLLLHMLLLLHGLLLLLREQRHELPGADMRDTCTKHKGSSCRLLLKTAVLLVCTVFFHLYISDNRHSGRTAVCFAVGGDTYFEWEQPNACTQKDS